MSIYQYIQNHGVSLVLRMINSLQPTPPIAGSTGSIITTMLTSSLKLDMEPSEGSLNLNHVVTEILT